MCGIVGVAGNFLTDGEVERFRELMLVSNLRGMQGAGVVARSSKAGAPVAAIKDLGTGLDLAYRNEEFARFCKDQRPNVLIGHTRWPTKGDVNYENTHPHVFDDVYGVHNGTMDVVNDHWVKKEESDSSLLYKSIAENGVKDTLNNSQGAYCLVWIDRYENTLNFLRNSRRPLYLAVNKKFQSTMYWASEYGMLSFVLGRHHSLNDWEIKALPEDSWLVYELPFKHRINETPMAIEKITAQAPEVVTNVAPFHHWTGGYTYRENGQRVETKTGKTLKEKAAELVGIRRAIKDGSNDTTNTGTTTTGTKSTTTNLVEIRPGDKAREMMEARKEVRRAEQELKKKLAPSVEELFPSMGEEGYYRETVKNYFVDFKHYSRLLESGCSWCSSRAHTDDKVKFVNHSEYLCKDCKDDHDAIKWYTEAVQKTA